MMKAMKIASVVAGAAALRMKAADARKLREHADKAWCERAYLSPNRHLSWEDLCEWRTYWRDRMESEEEFEKFAAQIEECERKRAERESKKPSEREAQAAVAAEKNAAAAENAAAAAAWNNRAAKAEARVAKLARQKEAEDRRGEARKLGYPW